MERRTTELAAGRLAPLNCGRNAAPPQGRLAPQGDGAGTVPVPSSPPRRVGDPQQAAARVLPPQGGMARQGPHVIRAFVNIGLVILAPPSRGPRADCPNPPHKELLSPRGPPAIHAPGDRRVAR